jgi:transcriptional regulator with PAS, ATPase and Fis domain
LARKRQQDPAELASLIEALPEPRILIDDEYRVIAASETYRAAYSDGGRVIGRHCYEVSHGYQRPCDQEGESCPLRAALDTGETARVLHIHHTPRGEAHVQVEITPVRDRNGIVRFFAERLETLPIAHASASAAGVVGRAPSFLRMLDLVARVAPTDTSVLLLGETGTGKEMVARAVHVASARADAPFVAVDCSGLTETLFESELFGHEKGAFTGALSRKIGLVEAAAGGTLFLDEIGDIPLTLQVKLLRLLETGTFRRVGGIEALKANFRLVAATHRDLSQMVKEERFRSDLYYRINAFPIQLPALRERRADVPLLAESLLERLRPGQAPRVSASALRALESYDFPGNIRELRNILERASLLADKGVIELAHLPVELRARESRCDASTVTQSALRTAESEALKRELEKHQGSRRALAASLGISERTLYRKLRDFGLSSR